MVGPPTHPVILDLVVLWEMSPPRGVARAGTRLLAREATRRARGAIGSELKPGAGGGELGTLWGQVWRLASGYLLSTLDIRLLQRKLNRFIAVSPFAGFVGRQLECWCASQSQPPSAAGAELDYVTAASFAIQLCIKARGLVNTKVHKPPCTTSIRVV